MPILAGRLDLENCPHCNVNKPNLALACQAIWTDRHSGGNKRLWKNYKCANCGSVVLAAARDDNKEIIEIYPSNTKETFEFDYLPQEVAEDFREALTCF